MKNNDEKFELSLNFDDHGANLFINGENRDDVFLLFSELKEYLLNEISIKKWTLQLFKEIFRVLPVFMIIGIFIFLVSSSLSQNQNISGESFNNILQSNDTNEKINFLIQIKSEESPSNPKIIYLFSVVLLSLIFSNNLAKFASYFFPSNLFLFGKEIDRYKKRLEIRSKLFWIIIIGLIITIVGGFIVNKIP
ncbi:MAG: hypothetical protein KAT13_06565 [Methanosarcinales archaeon]|nr:hypothetical protein [Methanosarcinales archaeon]MCK4652729.1 hypothetical protein [Methanosarcinales archaeon]